ncbi:MAG: response regulator transcription factor [Gemmatimonadaceae bacterium]|nr:response regulator transcription factor [Acetobacteraceae bacterium]
MTVARAFVDGLDKARIQVAWAQDIAAGLEFVADVRPEIVLVGLQPRDASLLLLVSQLVRRGDCGVIVLAGPDDEPERVRCLERGADDYLAKPPVVREMVARIRAVHRRRTTIRPEVVPVPAPVDNVLSIGPIRINLQHRAVHTADGRRLNLTSAEYAALETLARAEGEAVSRDRLSETALRRPWRAEDRSVDQLVFNLRQKLPTDPDGSTLIQSIRGSGYWLRAPDRPMRRRAEFAWLGDDAARLPEQRRVSA